ELAVRLLLQRAGRVRGRRVPLLLALADAFNAIRRAIQIPNDRGCVRLVADLWLPAVDLEERGAKALLSPSTVRLLLRQLDLDGPVLGRNVGIAGVIAQRRH